MPADTRPRRWTVPLLHLLGWCIGAALAWWQVQPLPQKFATHLPRVDNDPLFHAWSIHHWHQRWDALDFRPSLDANNFFPHSHVMGFSDTFLGQALVSYPAHLLGADVVAAHNVAFLLMYVAMPGAAFSSVLWLTRSMPGALTAMAGAALAQYRGTVADHLNIMSGFLLIPLLCVWLRWWRRPSARGGAWLGALWGAQWWFCGQLAVVGALAMAGPLALATVWRAATQPQRRARLLQGVVAALGMAALLGGPIAVGHVVATGSIGQVRTLEDNIAYSVALEEYRNVQGGSALQRWAGTVGGFAIYPGAVLAAVGVLGVLGILWRTRKRKAERARSAMTVVVLTVAVVAVVLSLGPVYRPHQMTTRLPYLALFEAFPLVRGMRCPSRFVVALQAALAVLAAVSVARFHLARGQRGLRLALALVIPLLVVWDLWPHPLRVAGALTRSPAMEEVGRLQPGAGVVEIPDGRPENFAAMWRSAFHPLRTSAGTSGATPPLTGALRCRSDRFPLPEATAVFQAMGATLVAVHPNTRPFVPDILLALKDHPLFPTLSPQDPQTTLFALPPATPSFLQADTLRGLTFPLLVPATVQPGSETHAALDLASLAVVLRVSVRPAVPVHAVWKGPDWEVRQRATVILPGVLDTVQHHAPVTLAVPHHTGPAELSLWLEDHRLATTTVTLGDAPLAIDRRAASGALTVDVQAWRWLTGRCGAIQLSLTNTGSTTLQAYADTLRLPAEHGRTNVDLHWMLNGTVVARHRAHQWQRRAAALWHDVGPGQQAQATVESPSPPTPGTYDLRVLVGVEGGPAVTQAEVRGLVVGRLSDGAPAPTSP